MKTYSEYLEQLKQQKLEYLDRLASEQRSVISALDYELCEPLIRDYHRRLDELEIRIGSQVSILRKIELLLAEITGAGRANELSIEQDESQIRETNEYGPKGFEGLKVKKLDLSGYYSNHLTPRQRDCYSLKNEYGLSVAEIARRLGITRPTVDEHLDAAEKKLENVLVTARESRRIKTMHN